MPFIPIAMLHILLVGATESSGPEYREQRLGTPEVRRLTRLLLDVLLHTGSKVRYR